MELLSKRPVYVVAHRCNSPREITESLQTGANAIECDVWEAAVAHDAPWPTATRLLTWLEAAVSASEQFGDRFALIYFDVKEPRALVSIVSQVRARIPSSIQVLYNISDFGMRDHFSRIGQSLRTNEGLCIDEHSDAAAVGGYICDSLQVSRSWYAYGVPARDEAQQLALVMPAVQDAIGIRDTGNVFNKVGVWTLTDAATIAMYLAMGVDALLVERSALPDAVELTVASERRLAIRSDSAFA